MKIPISWLKDYIDLDSLSVEEIARKLTLAGLEVDEIKYVGLPMPNGAASGMHSSERHEFKTSGLSWAPDKIVVAEIREVRPHPNADRLTLLDLYDGDKEQVVLTGAPNLFDRLPARAQYEARQQAQAYLIQASGRQLYQRRAGIEGTLSQGVRAFGLRR